MLRLGLLQCDGLDAPHVDVDGDYDVLFAALFAQYDIDLVSYRADHGQLPSSVRDCDAWLISGSRHSVYDEIDWITGLGRFTERIIERSRPLVGTCFGHQLIGRLLGAPVARAEVGWNIGAIHYAAHRHPGGNTAMPAAFTLIASHQDQVMELPPGTTLLAETPTCPIAAFGTPSVLAIQAHPEFTAPLARSLLVSRIERIGHQPVAAALQTLDRRLDRTPVANWIAGFVLDGGDVRNCAPPAQSRQSATT